MGRPPRAAEGGLLYHTLNRVNARLTIFDHPDDYDAFARVLDLAISRHPVRLLAYCLMPNHFHLILRPEGDGDLSRFMRWLTLTHTQRWHAHRHSAGSGHLDQGRFKSFPIQDDDHFLAACRRAGLVAHAQDWKWGSLAGPASGPAPHSWPVPRPDDWVARVDAPMTPAEEQAIGRSIRRGRPFGQPEWLAEAVARLGLQSTTRPPADPGSRPTAPESRHPRVNKGLNRRGRRGSPPAPPQGPSCVRLQPAMVCLSLIWLRTGTSSGDHCEAVANWAPPGDPTSPGDPAGRWTGGGRRRPTQFDIRIVNTPV